LVDHVRSADQSERPVFPPPSRNLFSHYPELSCLRIERPREFARIWSQRLLPYHVRRDSAATSCCPRGDCVQPNTRPGARNTGWTDLVLQQLPPVDQLIRKFGDLALVEFAVVGLKCTACGHRGANALMGGQVSRVSEAAALDGAGTSGVRLPRLRIMADLTARNSSRLTLPQS
jgi:hypothetical protein